MMNKYFGLLLCLVFCCAIVSSIKAPDKDYRKKLAGPPSEFASMNLPPIKDTGLVSDSAMIPFYLQPSRNGDVFSWMGAYPVDTESDITIAIISPLGSNLKLYVKPTKYDEYYLINYEFFADKINPIGYMSEGPFGIDGNVFPATTYTFYAIDIGNYEVMITSSVPPNRLHPGDPDGYIIFDNHSEYKLVSWVNTYALEEGSEVGISLELRREDLVSGALLTDLPAPTITTAELDVILPNGKEIQVTMHDDGLHSDMASNDGIYGASIEAAVAGDYVYHTFVKATTAEGHHLFRSSYHFVEITTPQLTLTGLGRSYYNEAKGVVSFQLDVDLVNDEADTVRAYAEVWGTDATGFNYVPIAWVQAMVDSELNKELNKLFIELDLDERWFALAGANPPFQLRNAMLQDRNTFAVLSERAEIFIDSKTSQNIPALINRARLLTNATIEITETMLWGIRPGATSVYHSELMRYQPLRTGTSALCLVHGYCSGQVWDPSDFTNSILFQDHSQSRSNDAFALLVEKFATNQGVSCYSIVGHSQGGLAATHLCTYYWSGLDCVTGGKIIQTVGSPYSGCSLAGNLAAIGSIFGVGCSANNDLTTTGAPAWLAKIPESSQKQVSYYTTTYPSGWLSSACITGSSLVMKTPNDGTCEIPYSKMPKGISMGNTEGQCHTSGMNYPQQTKDKARNSIINKAAAR